MLARLSFLALIVSGMMLASTLLSTQQRVPPVPVGCTAPHWMIAYNYWPITGDGHRFTQPRPWADYFEGISFESAEGVPYKLWFTPISPDSIVYNAMEGERVMQDLFVRHDRRCLFSSDPKMVNGYSYHQDLASIDTAATVSGS